MVPWAGIVRCEATGTLPLATVVALADTVTVALPRFASVAHKDPRAPQNLAPIGALERLLRHRLGDAQICYRALRAGERAPVLFRPLDRSGRLAWTLLELLIERPAVIDQAIPPAVSDTAGELLVVAKDAIEGVRDWASDTAERARDAVTPPKKKRSKLPLLLVLLGLGALAFYIVRKRGAGADTLVAGDFDAAV